MSKLGSKKKENNNIPYAVNRQHRPTTLHDRLVQIQEDGKPLLQKKREELFRKSSSLMNDQKVNIISPTPIPNSRLSTTDYYTYRHEDFLKRYNKYGLRPPDYYINYGFYYFQKFEVLKPKLSEKGRRWIDRTKLKLQQMMENILRENDGIELNPEKFKRVAFATHKEAYISSGLFRLSDWELVLISITPDLKDTIKTYYGRQQVYNVGVTLMSKKFLDIIFYHLYSGQKRAPKAEDLFDDLDNIKNELKNN